MCTDFSHGRLPHHKNVFEISRSSGPAESRQTLKNRQSSLSTQVTGRASIDKISTNELAICCEFSEFKPEHLKLWVFCFCGFFFFSVGEGFFQRPEAGKRCVEEGS